MATLYDLQRHVVELDARPAGQGQDQHEMGRTWPSFLPLKGLIMSIALKDALARLPVPELKDLVSHLPGAATASSAWCYGKPQSVH